MSTATVTLEPRNVAASVRSLKTEFAKANLAGMRATSRRGAVHVEIPIALLADYRFSYAPDHISCRTTKNKVIVEWTGFIVEQQIHKEAFLLVFRPSPNTSPIRSIFRQRSLRAVDELQALDEKKLAEAVQAPSDVSVLLTALNSDEALATLRARDPLAGARLRGLDAKRRLIEAEGGTLSGAEVARVLQITRQAVDKRRKEGKLLALELGKKGFRYPAWQLGLPHLDKALHALSGLDPWQQLSFFLNSSELLDGRTPLQVLQSRDHDIDDVLRAASVYGEHGA